MKRFILTSLIASMTLLPALRADGTATPEPLPTGDVSAAPETTPEAAPEEGTLVGQASHEGAKAAKRRQRNNILLAAGAVTLAATALILVASNQGHHHKH